MITSISSGQYITVSHNGQTYYNNTGMPMAGMMRYHSGGRIDVYDGNSWITASGGATITLSHDAEKALTWAIKKQAEEAEIERMSKEHPAVKAAYDNLKRAEEQLKATVILSKETQETIQHHPV